MPRCRDKTRRYRECRWPPELLNGRLSLDGVDQCVTEFQCRVIVVPRNQLRGQSRQIHAAQEIAHRCTRAVRIDILRAVSLLEIAAVDGPEIDAEPCHLGCVC